MSGLVRVVVVMMLAAARASVAEPTAEQRLYRDRCSACHGDDGKGDGPMAPALTPKPRNFRDPAFGRERSAADVRTIIQKGKPGTMMPPFAGVLTDAEIDALVRVVRNFGQTETK